MKVLLVRPPIMLAVARRLKPFLHLEPLALEIVAGGIPLQHETRILDLASENRPDAAFRRTLRTFRPEVIGFTAYSNQAGSAKRLAAQAKSVLPGVFVLIGGTHATVSAGDLRLPGVIDLVVRGEGGTVMRDLMALLERKAPVPASPALLPTHSPRFDELAALPPPELPPFEQVPRARRTLVQHYRYHCIWPGEPGRKLPEMFPRTATARSSVGCPHRCSFCLVPYLARGKYVRRTPQDIVSEIAGIREDHIYFVDDEMFIDAGRAEQIAWLLIDGNVRKHYISWARADTIAKHPELFKLWRQAGLSLVYVGLESMEPETLLDYNKGFSPEVNRQAIRILRDLHIGLHASLIIHPDFTDEDFVKVRRTVESLGPAEVSFTVMSPLPGTELWDEHHANFICPDPYAFYDCMHTLVPTKLPLKQFYTNLAILWALGARDNPWRRNKVKVSLRDLLRYLLQGMRYGWSVRNIYKDYAHLPAAQASGS
ncbi:MAG: radical SAM protein [Tepidisphaeraceae bacterium]